MNPITDDLKDQVGGASGLDLCEQEPIHIPGAIQQHGCLIVCGMVNWAIVALSSNCGDFLGADATDLLDLPLDEVLPDKTVHDLRNVLQAVMVSGTAERLARVPINASGLPHDLTIHVSGPHAVIEIMRRSTIDAPTSDPLSLIKNMIGRAKRAPTLERFLHVAASQVRAITGFDRVMVYQFLPDQSGRVAAESLRSGLTPFLGLHYPASDIPAQARALYKRQPLRVIPDIAYTPVPLVSRTLAPSEIDLSLAELRSVSPVHLEYLRNMGSKATLTISLLDGDRLWGLIACHHETPRRIPSSTCAAAELFAQIFSLQIETKVQARSHTYVALARDAHDRLLASMSPEETMFDNLGRFADVLRELIPCDGLGVYSEKGYFALGQTLPATQIEAFLNVLGQQPGDEVFVSDTLGGILPEPSSPNDCAGVIAVPITRMRRDYLMFFRQEVLQTVTWGGNPQKPTEPGPGSAIGPRKSFEAWRETVRGRSLPWTADEVQVAETLRVSLLEVILRRSDLMVKEREAAQKSQAFLIAELNHRVKNILALIRSLLRQTRIGALSIESFADDLEHRVSSLALAHDQLTAAGWKNTPLRRLLEAELRAWTQAPARICFKGPPVTLGSRAIQSLALVFHELVTNAAKHGALSVPDGLLSVAWFRDEDGPLRLEWRETGGPQVVPPMRRGFGSVVVEQVIPFELGGEVTLDYRPEGLFGRFSIPANHVGDDEADVETPVPEPQKRDLAFERLLLVEDSMMIALDAQAMLQDAGLDVDVAGTVAEAHRLLDAHPFDVAVLDINLSGEASFGIAEDLVRRGLPFVFATGYGESVVIPDHFKSVPIVAKPYDKLALKSALTTAGLAKAEEPQGVVP